MNFKKIFGLCAVMICTVSVVGEISASANNNSNACQVIKDVAITSVNASDEEYANILKQLKDIDSQEEALDKQEYELKQQYRNGQITREQFLTQMAELEKKEDELDKQEDALELKLDQLKKKTLNSDVTVVTPSTATNEAVDIQNKTIEEALSKLAELDKQDEELDRLEDELEYKYRSGQISRDSFIAQMQELEKRERAIDLEEDAWEMQITSQRKANQNTGTSAKKSANIEAQEEALDRQEDELEQKYRNGQISRQEFYNQKAAIEAKEDELDRLEDANSNYGVSNYGNSDYASATTKKKTTATTKKTTSSTKKVTGNNTNYSNYGNSNYSNSGYSNYDD